MCYFDETYTVLLHNMPTEFIKFKKLDKASKPLGTPSNISTVKFINVYSCVRNFREARENIAVTNISHRAPVLALWV